MATFPNIVNIDVKTGELLCTRQVSLTDHGRWMCLMNENSTFNSVKQWLDLAVAVVPSTGVTLTLAGDSEHDADSGEEQLLLSYHLFQPLLITSLLLFLSDQNVVTFFPAIIYSEDRKHNIMLLSLETRVEVVEGDRLIYTSTYIYI